MSEKNNEYLECGMICSTHGVKGAVRLESRCDTPDVLAKLKRVFFREENGYREVKVLHAFVQKSIVIASLEGIETVEAAQALRNTVLYAARQDFNLGKGDFFIADLIGLDIINGENGEKIGVLKDVIKPGAQQIYVVEREEGEFMIPAVAEFIKEISLETGIKVKLIEGLAD